MDLLKGTVNDGEKAAQNVLATASQDVEKLLAEAAADLRAAIAQLLTALPPVLAEMAAWRQELAAWRAKLDAGIPITAGGLVGGKLS